MKYSPDLIFLETKITLTLQSTDGRRAWYTVKNRAKVLKPLEERLIRYGSDGEVKIVTVSPGSVVEQTRLIGGYLTRIKFDPPLQTNSPIDMKMELLYIDSFTSPHEYFAMPIEYPVEHLYYEIIFPLGSEVIESSITSIREGKETKEFPPAIKRDETGCYRIIGERKNLSGGTEYRIEWTWHPKSPVASERRV